MPAQGVSRKRPIGPPGFHWLDLRLPTDPKEKNRKRKL